MSPNQELGFQSIYQSEAWIVVTSQQTLTMGPMWGPGWWPGCDVVTPLTASSGENADTLSAQWIINNNDSQAWQTIDVTHKCDCFFTTGMKLNVEKYDYCGLFIVFWFDCRVMVPWCVSIHITLIFQMDKINVLLINVCLSESVRLPGWCGHLLGTLECKMLMWPSVHKKRQHLR